MPSLADIPGGITLDHFVKITELLKQVLAELEPAGAKRVVTRLNDSRSSEPDPYFVGIVEANELVRSRVRSNQPDPGLFRFGDANPSKVYNETVSHRLGKVIRRNWKTKHYDEKKGTAKALGHEAGCDHQRFIALRIPLGQGRHQNVGTLTVGFKKNPSSRVEAIMKRWAQNPKSEFVTYLRNTFGLNGPTF